MGSILPGSPPPSIPRGTGAQCGLTAPPLSPLPGGPEGTGKGLSPLPRGAGCTAGHSSPGTQALRVPLGQGVCTICIRGQQVQGLARVAEQGPAPLAEHGRGFRTATAAVSLHQASLSLPAHLIPCLLPVCLSHTMGTSAMCCRAPRASWCRAPWPQEIPHSPGTPWPHGHGEGCPIPGPAQDPSLGRWIHAWHRGKKGLQVSPSCLVVQG